MPGRPRGIRCRFCPPRSGSRESPLPCRAHALPLGAFAQPHQLEDAAREDRLTGTRMPADNDLLMIIVGGDALALSTAHELCQLADCHVVVLWRPDLEFARAVEGVGARFVAGRPDSRDALEMAGVAEAVTILALSRDDQLNLQAALRARDANPAIRIVLRQFNRTLAAKIEQNLANCSVLSLAWHSAATYAAAALDSSCIRGLQFPEPDGPLTRFAMRLAEDERIAGHNIVRAEQTLGARIVAINGVTELGVDTTIPAGARLVCYGPLHRLLASASRRIAIHRHAPLGRRFRDLPQLEIRRDPDGKQAKPANAVKSAADDGIVLGEASGTRKRSPLMTPK